MRRTIAIGVILLFLWLAYSVWPFFAVYRLASAVQVRDVAAVKELVDFRALRGSLTAQIVRTYLRMTGKVGRSGSMLEQFARRSWSFGRRPDRGQAYFPGGLARPSAEWSAIGRFLG